MPDEPMHCGILMVRMTRVEARFVCPRCGMETPAQ